MLLFSQIHVRHESETTSCCLKLPPGLTYNISTHEMSWNKQQVHERMMYLICSFPLRMPVGWINDDCIVPTKHKLFMYNVCKSWFTMLTAHIHLRTVNHKCEREVNILSWCSPPHPTSLLQSHLSLTFTLQPVANPHMYTQTLSQTIMQLRSGCVVFRLDFSTWDQRGVLDSCLCWA